MLNDFGGLSCLLIAFMFTLLCVCVCDSKDFSSVFLNASFFFQTSLEFASKYNGYKHNKQLQPPSGSVTYYKPPPGAKSLPHTVDWREKNVTTPVKNQVHL